MISEGDKALADWDTDGGASPGMVVPRSPELVRVMREYMSTVESHRHVTDLTSERDQRYDELMSDLFE